MRTYRIKNWHSSDYNYDMQVEDCENGKIISLIKTTTKGIHSEGDGFAKSIDRIAISYEALKSIGLNEKNLVQQLTTNAEMRNMLKYGEDFVDEGLIRTSKLFLSLKDQQIYVCYESLADKYKFRLPLKKENFNTQYLEYLTKALDYTSKVDNATLSEPAILNLRGVIFEEDYPIVGRELSDNENTI